MEILLETEERIRLRAGGEGFAFEAGEAGLSPFHLLAASLATCTHSVLHGWAHHAGLDLDGLEIVVEWELGEDPVRVTGMDMAIVWPGLPAARHGAAVRAAAQCTVHNTLSRGTPVETRVAGPVGEGATGEGSRP